MSKHQPLVRVVRESSRLRFEAGFLLVTLVIITLCLSLLFRAAGFPQDHEIVHYQLRTAIYAEHFRHGDLFPMWASSDGRGMGTPLPLFYHKTFYYVSGSIYLVTGSMKGAITVTLALFMLAGAYGMRFCLAKLTKRQSLLLLGPQAFLLSNYVFTDWLVRGAMAEFSAVMIIPWLIWWCLVLLKDRRFSLAIALIVFLVIQSHNVTALFGIILPIIAYGLFLYSAKIKGLLQTWKPGLLSVGLLAVLMGPLLVLQQVFLRDYDPSKVTQAGYVASNNFRPASQYFLGDDYTWLKDWRPMTVQIDYGIWVVLVASLIIVGLCLIFRRQATIKWAKHYLLQPYSLFLVLSFAAYVLLQLKITKPLYEHVQFMQFLQFPWRLLAYITPLGILLVILFLSGLRLHRVIVLGVTVAWLALFILLSPLPHRFQFAFFSPQEVRNHSTFGHPELTGTELAGIGEYYPRVYDASGRELSTDATVALYQTLYDQKSELQVLQGTCNIAALPQHSLEVSSLYFRYTCKSTSQVALPISFSRLSYVTNNLNHEKIIRFRKPTDPRMLVNLTPGRGLLEVHLPSVATAWHMLFVR